ncbi:MAG: hypothetical protein IT427_19035 [Pirellulales bacterium]|nr:hypothetical protein [Pirellulales bacterium]
MHAKVGKFDHLLCGTINCGSFDAKIGKVDELLCRTVIAVLGPNNKPAVIIGTDADTKSGLIETRTADGTEQAVLKSTPPGGSLILYAPDRKQVVYVKPGGEQPVIVLPNERATNHPSQTSPADAKDEPKEHAEHGESTEPNIPEESAAEKQN